MTAESVPRPPPTPAAVDPGVLGAELVGAIGGRWVITDERRRAYTVDGHTPAFVVLPGNAEEVAAVLAVANRAGAAVIPWGGGSARALGYPPRAAHVALDLRRLNQVLQYEPADLTVSVQAGITFAALTTVLAAHGQRLPLDCAPAEVATLGGLVATNPAGPRRLRYGTLRDLLIGIRVAHPDGTLSRGGGMVVKNVSGYDMMKLYLGSLGTLAVIVEVNCKVAPLPATEGTALAVFPALEPALAAAEVLLASQLLPCAVVVADRAVAMGLGFTDAGALLAIRFEGQARATERQLAEVRAQGPAWGAEAVYALEPAASEAFWTRVVAFQTPDVAPINSALLKLSVLPSTLGPCLADVAELSAQVDLRCLRLADAGAGIVYARVGQPEERSEAVFAWALWALQTELVRRWGQSVVLSCPTVAKANLPLWGREPAGLAVMRALKEQFDPRGILNPGRFVGGI
jgi:glycolate oxidase FAD binding subunit